MAAKSLRQNGEGTSRPNSSENGSQFFKIILSSQDTTTLRFPKKFVRKYGKNLPKVVSCEVPTGDVWEIELIHSEGRILLAKGWEEFTNNYSIGYGHFLVFKYDGKSHFHVIIFDQSATEIEYPHKEKQRKFRETEDVSEDDLSIEILNNCSMDFVTKKRKRKEDNHQMEDKEMPKMKVKIEKNSQDDWSSPSLTTKIKEETSAGPKTYEQQFNSKKQILFKKEMSEAYQRAKAFKSKNPFHISVMYSTYVSKPYRMCIPLSFAKNHFSSKFNNDVVLVSSGRSWPVRCTLSTHHASINGWGAFVQDNRLKLGDVCIFEAVKGEKLVFNVVIFRDD